MCLYQNANNGSAFSQTVTESGHSNFSVTAAWLVLDRNIDFQIKLYYNFSKYKFKNKYTYLSMILV